MKKILLLVLPILMLTYLSCQRKSDSQTSDWQSAHVSNLDGFVSKQVGKIKYTMHSSRSIEEREEIIKEAGKHIAECLEIVGEDEFNDSLHIALVHNLDEAEKYFGFPFAGLTGLKQDALIEDMPEYKDVPFVGENSIRCIYVIDSEYNPLKHEIMHIIMFTKWGYEAIEPQWLIEGVPTFANPEYYSCDGLTLEERYAYLLQNDKLLDIEGLTSFPKEGSQTFTSGKSAYCQAGYLVEYLYKNYGIRYIKKLWIESAKAYRTEELIIQENMYDQGVEKNDSIFAKTDNIKLTTFLSVFEEVYGVSFEKMIERINKEIEMKYPDSINLSWEEFSKKKCIE